MSDGIKDWYEQEATEQYHRDAAEKYAAQRASKAATDAPLAATEAPLAIELRFTVGPWFETEGEYPNLRAAPVRAEGASCVAVENDTARAWDWGETCDLDGYTPSFNMAACTHKWPGPPGPLPYSWAIYTPNDVAFEPGIMHQGRCASRAQAQTAADAALAEYCAKGRRSAGGASDA